MDESNKGTVLRMQAQLLAYHRAGMTPTQSDVATLWDVVMDFDFDVFERAIYALQSPLWKGAYPPNPSDIVAQCNTIASSDGQKAKSASLASERSHVLHLAEHQNAEDISLHDRARNIRENEGVDMGVAYARSILQMLETKK